MNKTRQKSQLPKEKVIEEPRNEEEMPRRKKEPSEKFAWEGLESPTKGAPLGRRITCGESWRRRTEGKGKKSGKSSDSERKKKRDV